MNSKKVLVVAGPTASGKSDLGIILAKALGGEIVSADSMQIYRGMDIGTAKATREQQSAVPHHMIDVADPMEDYSVSRYVEDAAACCEDIFIRGRSKNMLLGANGQNVYPEEIEDKLNNMLMVSESLVIQKGDKFIGLVHPDFYTKTSDNPLSLWNQYHNSIVSLRRASSTTGMPMRLPTTKASLFSTTMWPAR